MMQPDGNLATASGDLHQEAVPSWIALESEPVLRTIERPDVPLTLGGAAKSALALYEETILRNESRIALVGPARLGELSMLHSLAAIHRVEECDRERLTTMVFPWSRSSTTYQRNVVVDRPMLCERISRALHRLDGRPLTQKDAYIVAINSLKTILNDATKSDV